MNEIAKTYQKENRKYDDFRKKVDELIRELLLQRDIRVHKIESRCKEVDKLDEKINRKNNKYGDILEITDIIGIRIITYFEDEVDIIASIIEDEFVKDSENSIDKRNLEMDRFGYKSLHYVVSLKDDRKELTEYKRFKDIKFEIQIRSVLQHAWAEIEHDIGYKSELSLPNSLKRDFYRVAALLETADIEFVKIKERLKEYERNIEKEINENPEEVEINDLSIKSYTFSEPKVIELDKKITVNYNSKLSSSYHSLNNAMMLHYLNIKTIKHLDTILKSKESEIINFANKWLGRSHSKNGSMVRGVSIIYLLYLLVGEKNDIEFAKNFYFKKIGKLENEEGVLKIARKMIDTYNEIKIIK